MTAAHRVRYRGYTVSARIRDMLKWAEAKSGSTVAIAQGSFNGTVSASGGTHTGEAVDLRVRHLTSGQRVKLVHALKDAGFAAWYRAEVPGLWGPHIHAIPFGGAVSSAARSQLVAFDAGRDGLRGNRLDRTYRPDPRVKWNYDKGRPVRR
jgi:hypothetical protein